MCMKTNFFEPGKPFIIVKEITNNSIAEAREAYTENDAYFNQ